MNNEILNTNMVEINCDFCDKEIIDYDKDLFHFTGILNGLLNTHIHSCAKCVDILNLSEYYINFDTKFNENV